MRQVAEGKEKHSIPNIIRRAADSERANVAHRPFNLEMLARVLPSPRTINCISDKFQVVADVLYLVCLNFDATTVDVLRSKKNHPNGQQPKHVQALRNSFIQLETERRRVVEGTSGVGTIVAQRVGPVALEMKQLIESEDSNDALLTWASFLRLHDFLEKLISSHIPDSQAGNDPSGIWLSTFARSQFQACIPLVEDELLRVLPATMNGAEMERVQSIFNSVLKCELALLDSAYARNQTNLKITQQSSGQWHPSNIIFTTDFDVTCTVVDSSETLVKAAEAAAADSRPGRLLEEYESVLDRHAERTRKVFSTLEGQNGETTPSSLLSGRDVKSAHLVRGMDPLLKPLFDSIDCSSFVCPDKVDRDSPFDEAGLRRALTALADLEVLCNQDIMSTGVLRGPTREGIKSLAKQVQLRANCAHVLQLLVEVGTAIHVVSANWSRDLIVGGLPELAHEMLFTHCNDLLFDESGLASGIIDNTVVDAFDKEQMIQALRKIYSHVAEKNLHRQGETPVQGQRLMSKTNRKAGEKMLVYMGDSHTDLLGLLEADLGIVIGDTATVRRVMSLYGIQLLPLAKASAFISLSRANGSECSWRRSGILFEAQGWGDVEACLFGSASTQASGRLTKQHGEEAPEDQSTEEKSSFDSSNSSQGHLPAFRSDHMIRVAA